MENSNSIKRKINLFGKIGYIIVTVLIVLLLIAEGALLTCGIVMTFLPKDVVTVDTSGTATVRVDTEFFGANDGDFSIPVNGVKLKIADFKADDLKTVTQNGVASITGDVKDMHFDLTNLMQLVFIGFLKLAAITVALFFFRALLKQFRSCDSPFTDDVVKAMRTFAIALIPTMVVASSMNSLKGGVFSGDYDFGNVDLITAGFVLVVFMLTAIFRYGAQLQKQYDDTV